MIKSVTVTNHLGESIEIELRFPEKSGFLIKNIDGLGPTATINSTELATDDGSIYTSSKVSSRNIVLTLGFIESPTIEEVRIKSYKYFPIKKKIKLLIETDSRTSEIYGYVESNQPDVFNKEETAQISILCVDPYFYSDENNETIFSGIESLFEFEFENEFEGAMFGSNTITMDSAMDFKIGDVVSISGCKLESNNKVARITGVSVDKKTFSFTNGLFVPSIEASIAIYKITNGIYNGDLSNGLLGWTGYYSDLSIVETNILTATANSTSTTYPGVSQPTNIPATSGRKVYVRLRMKVTNTLSTFLKLILYDGALTLAATVASITAPVKDQWYTLSGIVTIPSGKTGNLNIRPRHYYADGATAIGKVVKMRDIELVDMGLDDTNPLFNKVLSQMDDLFAVWSDDKPQSNLTSSISMGNVKNDTLQQIYYEGDAEVGVAISVRAMGPVSNVTIYNIDTRESMRINTSVLATLTGLGFNSGDEILISTVKGDKYVKLLRNGIYTNILNCLDKDANWFTLSKGYNTFAYSADSGVDELEFSIQNKIVYEGV